VDKAVDIFLGSGEKNKKIFFDGFNSYLEWELLWWGYDFNSIRLVNFDEYIGLSWIMVGALGGDDCFEEAV